MKLRRDWKEIGLWTLGKRWRFRVSGNSMLPTLRSGEDILVHPVPKHAKIYPGDIVVCRHPQQPHLRMVKRVTEAFYDGSCYVLSDNVSEGSDSRSFGVLDRGLILGRVTSRLV
ncbi:MAG: nickel-type superoxide dismutase maturation protease [Cyanobacteria bacterium J06623_4]